MVPLSPDPQLTEEIYKMTKHFRWKIQTQVDRSSIKNINTITWKEEKMKQQHTSMHAPDQNEKVSVSMKAAGLNHGFCLEKIVRRCFQNPATSSSVELIRVTCKCLFLLTVTSKWVLSWLRSEFETSLSFEISRQLPGRDQGAEVKACFVKSCFVVTF